MEFDSDASYIIPKEPVIVNGKPMYYKSIKITDNETNKIIFQKEEITIIKGSGMNENKSI